MLKCLLLIIFLIPSLINAKNAFLDSPPQGWHWNNVPAMTLPKKQVRNNESPSQQLKHAQKVLDNVKAEAVLNPTPENVYAYLTLQHYIMERSSLFANVAYQVVNTNPELNYDLKNPTSSLARKAYLNNKDVKQKQVAQEIAKHFGLFFFYRGKNKADIATASIIQRFADRYGFSLIGVPMDGTAISLIKNNQPDKGQSQLLGVRALPALFLVDPKSKSVKVLRYGYPSEDELLNDLYMLAEGVKND